MGAGIRPPRRTNRAGDHGRSGMMGAADSEVTVPRSSRENPMRRIMELRRKYPEEMKKLDAIRRENPKAYRDGVMELLKNSGAEQGKAPKQ